MAPPLQIPVLEYSTRSESWEPFENSNLQARAQSAHSPGKRELKIVYMPTRTYLRPCLTDPMFSTSGPGISGSICVQCLQIDGFFCLPRSLGDLKSLMSSQCRRSGLSPGTYCFALKGSVRIGSLLTVRPSVLDTRHNLK
jgi:hypothetical protein